MSVFCVCVSLFFLSVSFEFLAAMSGSRSDIVTQSVCLLVRSFVCLSIHTLLFSFSGLEFLMSPKEFQGFL